MNFEKETEILLSKIKIVQLLTNLRKGIHPNQVKLF